MSEVEPSRPCSRRGLRDLDVFQKETFLPAAEDAGLAGGKVHRRSRKPRRSRCPKPCVVSKSFRRGRRAKIAFLQEEVRNLSEGASHSAAFAAGVSQERRATPLNQGPYFRNAL